MVMEVNTQPSKGTMVDGSGSITSGGTAEALFAAKKDRKYLLVQNLHASADLWIDFDGTTAVEDQPSVKMEAGATYILEGPYCPNGAISVIGGTTGQKFTAKESE